MKRLLCLLAFATAAHAQPGPDVAMAVLDSLAAHPRAVSLAVVPLDGSEPSLLINAGAPRPLASTIKLLVLTEYARQVEEGALDGSARVPLAEVEAFYFAGLDGGAHPAAMEALLGPHDTLALDDLAEAMIQFSDNAATDYLLFRLGRDAVEAIPERLELNGDAPAPISGLFLAWDLPPAVADTLEGGTPEERAWALADRLRTDAAFRDEVRSWMLGLGLRMSPAQQATAARGFPAGTALGYADLMARLHRGLRTGEAVAARVYGFLDWPMAHAAIAEGFDRFGTKGGALPGVLTSATLADAKPRSDGTDPAAVAVAFFLDGLPLPLWASWAQSFAQQQFELRLLADPAFRETVRTRLGER